MIVYKLNFKKYENYYYKGTFLRFSLEDDYTNRVHCFDSGESPYVKSIDEIENTLSPLLPPDHFLDDLNDLNRKLNLNINHGVNINKIEKTSTGSYIYFYIEIFFNNQKEILLGKLYNLNIFQYIDKQN